MGNLNTIYAGVLIEYNEADNVWEFNVRGRDRQATSLENAKKAIDRPEPKEKPPFERVEVFYMASYRDPVRVTVTSQAISRYGQDRYRIISGPNSKVEVVNARDLYGDTPSNRAAAQNLQSIRTQIEKLNKESNRIQESMTRAAL